jgi:hypothetical protein
MSAKTVKVMTDNPGLNKCISIASVTHGGLINAWKCVILTTDDYNVSHPARLI